MTVGKFTTCEVNKVKILNSTNQGVLVINACFEVLMRKPIDKRLYIVYTQCTNNTIYTKQLKRMLS